AVGQSKLARPAIDHACLFWHRPFETVVEQACDRVETRVTRAVSVVTKHFNSTSASVREARGAALNVLAMGVIIAVLYFGRLFFVTSLVALTIAFILEPFVVLLMRLRLPRSLASFVVCTFALAVLYVIGLSAYSQVAGLYGDLPKY